MTKRRQPLTHLLDLNMGWVQKVQGRFFGVGGGMGAGPVPLGDGEGYHTHTR